MKPLPKSSVKQTTHEPRQYSLSFVVTFWTAVAIAASMAFYAILQHELHPELTARELLLRHMWHVLALGGVTYLTLWLVFRRFLWRPLNQVFLHLYGVSKGHLEPLRLQSNIREIATIAESINLMIWHIGREIDPKARAHATESLAELRRLLGRITEENPELFGEFTELFEKLEQSVLSLAMTPSSPEAGESAA